MKNYIYILVAAILFQSCQSLVPISNNEAEVGKKYVINLTHGAKLKGRYEKTVGDTLTFNINNNHVKLPKSRIKQLNKVVLKKKTIIIGSVLTAAGIAVIVGSLPKDKGVDLIR